MALEMGIRDRSNADADTDSMTGILSSIGTFAISDAQAETGTGTKNEIGLANKVVAKLQGKQNKKQSKSEIMKQAAKNAKKAKLMKKRQEQTKQKASHQAKRAKNRNRNMK